MKRLKLFIYAIIMSIVGTAYYLYTTQAALKRKNPEKWIVVTSINDRTVQIERLSKIKGFQLLVVGDLKTNKNWSYENVIYLSSEKQKSLQYSTYSILPFNSYTRKNIGYLYAIQNGAKCIYDTDDDNAPIHDLDEYF